MKSLFFYLAQVVVVSGILYAYYHFALRNKKFHQYNRFYILGATLASVLIPFLNIPVYFTGEEKWMYALQNLSSASVVIAVDSTAEIEKPFNWQGLLYCFYALVAVAGLTKILISVRRLKKIMRQHPAEHLNGIRFINTSEPGTPFSFFRWLFWNDRIELSSQKGEQIFRHEIYHIEQKHSIDSVFMEIITIVFWINPFFHLMKKELKAIHEFLADRFASHDTEKWEYAEMLLMQALNTQHSLVQPFFHNQIKRRIAMITNPQKTSHQYLRKLLVLPLGALLVTLFAFSYQQKSPEPVTEVTILDLHQPSTTDSMRNGKLKDITADVFVKGDGFNAQNQKVKPQLIIFNGKQFTSKEFENFTGEKRRNVFINAASVVSTPPNDQKAIDQYGEKARNGVLEFKTATIDTVPSARANTIRITGSPVSGKEPLIVLDGVLKDNNDYKLTLQQLDPDKIQSISILKDASATGLYGDKGKNGVLLITTKKEVDVKEVRLETIQGTIVADSISYTVNSRNHPVNLQFKTTGDIKVAGQANKLEEVTVVGYGTKRADGNQVMEVRTVPSNTVKGQLEEVQVKGKLQTVTVESTNRTFTKVEVEPAFPGGASAWYSFLAKNLDAGSPARSNAPAGEYTVQVRMKVSDDGRLSDFKAITNHGFGMEAAAIRALQNSPYWNPAYQNGKAVNAVKTQAFTFVVKGETPKLPEVTINAIPSASVYPNPANDRIFVRLEEGSEEREVTVRIVDMAGKEKIRSTIKKVKGSTVNGFNIGSLAPGTYILNLEGKGMTSSSHKFVKE